MSSSVAVSQPSAPPSGQPAALDVAERGQVEPRLIAPRDLSVALTPRRRSIHLRRWRLASLPHICACVEDCRTLPLRDFLERYTYGDAKAFLNNHLTRALAAGRLGRIVLDVSDANRMLDFALRSLEEDYDFVGLSGGRHTGRPDTRRPGALRQGLPPVRATPPQGGGDLRFRGFRDFARRRRAG